MYPYYTQPTPQGNPYQIGLENVKGFFRKPLILVVAIVYSLFFLSTIATTLMQVMEYSAYYGSLYNPMSGYISIAFTAIIMGLLCLAVWLIYLKSRSNKPTASPSAGLTILYVYAIIALVLVCLLTGILLIAIIGLLAAGNNSSFLWDVLGEAGVYYQYVYSVGVPILLLIVCIVMAILILYVVSMLRFVGSARRSLRSSAMYKGGSIASGIFFSIAALGTISNLINYFTLYGYSPLFKILLIVNGILSVAFLVLMAVVSFAYYGYCSKVNYAAMASAPRPDVYSGGYPSVQPNPYGGYAPNSNAYSPYGQPQNQQKQNDQAGASYYGNPYGGQSNPYAPPTAPSPYAAPSQKTDSFQEGAPYAPPYQNAPAPQTINDSLPVNPVSEQDTAENGTVDLFSNSSAQAAFHSAESSSSQPETPKNIWEPSPAPAQAPYSPEVPAQNAAPSAEPVNEASISPAPADASSDAAAPAEEEVKCPTCGALLPKGSHFCFRCGGRVD